LTGSSFNDGGTPVVAASVPCSLSLLRFRPFPLLILFGEAMLVAVGVARSAASAMDGSASVALGVAGSASVASGVVGSAAGGSTFNNGVTPAVAASILHLSLLLRFCFFLLFFDEREARSASVVSSCALMGSLFDDGGTPAAAASVSSSLSLLRFRPFPLLAMLVAVGVAGCAYVVNSCALTGLSFDDGGAPSKATSVRSFRFRSFLLLFGEAMLVRVGGVVWEGAAEGCFACAWIRSLKSKRM
jgi:hypothetical protein